MSFLLKPQTFYERVANWPLYKVVAYGFAVGAAVAWTVLLVAERLR